MHVLFRESVGLEEAAQPEDLAQTPAVLVVLSFSDSDLGAFASGWSLGRSRLPSLRLANLSRLKHPLSIDTYSDQTLAHAKAILVRLIGGKSYWPYGVDELARISRQNGIALAILSGDGVADPVLEAASTLPVDTLRQLSDLCQIGGEDAARQALLQLAHVAGLASDGGATVAALPNHGFWHPHTGVGNSVTGGDQPLVLIPFYRSWLTAADTASIASLIEAFEASGFRASGAFLPSLKDAAAAAWLRAVLPEIEPAAIVNATAFSGQTDGTSPLDGTGAPVFQIIHATSDRSAWLGAERGLSPADLAMHVALPELDGRICAGVVSFKETVPTDLVLQSRLQRHAPDPERVKAAVARVLGWCRLRYVDVTELRTALILSTYPGKEWRLAHAVGLDALESAAVISQQLGRAMTGDEILRDLKSFRLTWSLAEYRKALDGLPPRLRTDLLAAYGEPTKSPEFAAFWAGRLLIALQPERGSVSNREADYHDLSQVPAHEYVAFYLFLRHHGIDALVHIGAHGTLEWLPGKAVALSADCWPDALIGATPVLYPFIVNDPGEAAQARRRVGAVTLGHLPPPLVASKTPKALLRLESLLDEYSTADGLDTPRRKRLIERIREEAQRTDVDLDLGLPKDASDADLVTTIDRFVCDLKESQFGDGLHIWGIGTPDNAGVPQGDAASLENERAAILNALQGQRVPSGPSGSPYRGRGDVLPTGRNLYGVDPRAIPTRVAWAQGIRLGDELMRRHMQDQGDYPRSLIVNLWGSATMRTAGEDFAMALYLAGLSPIWDETSERISGLDITPLAMLRRPRVEVTLRVSGLFRDTFPELITLYQQGCAALAEREEDAAMNLYVSAMRGSHIFGPAPGHYGAGISLDMSAEKAGQAWLQSSAYGHSSGDERSTLEARISGADAFVLSQDLPETDLLLAEDYVAHEAGFVAARAALGLKPAVSYHLDATRPDAPKARRLPEEIARVVRARASNPQWLVAMMRHGFRGAAEIVATLEHMAAFSRLANAVPEHLFDLYHEATLGSPQVRDFIADANPGALVAMEAIFVSLGIEPDQRRNSRIQGRSDA